MANSWNGFQHCRIIDSLSRNQLDQVLAKLDAKEVRTLLKSAMAPKSVLQKTRDLFYKDWIVTYEEQASVFHALHVDLIAYMFTFLRFTDQCRCKPVCSYFWKILEHHAQQAHFAVIVDHNLLDSSRITDLPVYFKFISVTQKFSWNLWYNESLCDVIVNCSAFLQELRLNSNIDWWNGTNANFHLLACLGATTFPNLKKLHWGEMMVSAFPSEHLYFLGKRIISGCPALEEFTLLPTNHRVSEVCAALLLPLIDAKGPQFTVLDLKLMSPIWETEDHSVELLATIQKRCTQLHTLRVTFNLDKLVFGFPKSLRTLEICLAEMELMVFLRAMPAHIETLVVLSKFHDPMTVLQVVPARWTVKNLRRLELRAFQGVGFPKLQAFINKHQKYFPHLFIHFA